MKLGDFSATDFSTVGAELPAGWTVQAFPDNGGLGNLFGATWRVYSPTGHIYALGYQAPDNLMPAIMPIGQGWDSAPADEIATLATLAPDAQIWNAGTWQSWAQITSHGDSGGILSAVSQLATIAAPFAAVAAPFVLGIAGPASVVGTTDATAGAQATQAAISSTLTETPAVTGELLTAPAAPGASVVVTNPIMAAAAGEVAPAVGYEAQAAGAAITNEATGAGVTNESVVSAPGGSSFEQLLHSGASLVPAAESLLARVLGKSPSGRAAAGAPSGGKGNALLWVAAAALLFAVVSKR